MKFFKSMIIILCCTVAMAGCSKKFDGIIMGTNATFPPFEYKGGSDGSEIVGFDVDVAKAIAKKSQKQLKVEDMAFDALLTALDTGKIDMVIAGMTITDDRQKSVDFSTPYFIAKQVVISKASNDIFKTADDLNGKKIGVQIGTTGDTSMTIFAQKDMTGKTIVTRFQAGELAILDLKNGKLDAVVIDVLPAMNFIKKNPDLKIIDGIGFEEESYGIAVKKGNTELLELINQTLQEIRQNGNYDALLDQYTR